MGLPKGDRRQKLGAKPLRRSEEFIPLVMDSHISENSDGRKEYIYEAQISIMVTGVDDWVCMSSFVQAQFILSIWGVLKLK